MVNRSQNVYIIAEAGVNHNGSLDLAKKLIDVAAEAGADAVKFQTFKADNLVRKNASKAEYQTRTTDASESQYAMIKKLELDEEDHQILIQHCDHRGIQFLSTPFDFDSVDLLVHKFNVKQLKISSGEITNAPLLLKAARSSKPIILSTGMSTLGEVEQALAVLAFGYTEPDSMPSIEAFHFAYCSVEGQQALRQNVVLLHCTTEYPAPFEDVNLRAMDTLATAFGLPVGFSDHTSGIAVPIAAVARGAVVIEKHFTLDRNLPGPDHKASLEPDELKDMVRSIRQVEAALGSPLKTPAPSELKNISVARKSLVAARTIREGEIFTTENLTVKRPGDGISPMYYWEWLGKTAEKNYEADEKVRR
ncbi:N-acetylneuraminate synthase [Effusibacillus consociatus]|uniref:N-acetylneuraminate synthase n=1 Tax=Effusibacillus consociatus TaxID=1117041 RepID=A0ABV9Q2F5_9BACL